jgi:hypothetical protein
LLHHLSTLPRAGTRGALESTTQGAYLSTKDMATLRRRMEFLTIILARICTEKKQWSLLYISVSAVSQLVLLRRGRVCPLPRNISGITWIQQLLEALDHVNIVLKMLWVPAVCLTELLERRNSCKFPIGNLCCTKQAIGIFATDSSF